MSPETIWNAILTFISGMLILAIKDHKVDVKELQGTINQVRVDIASNYVSKTEFQLDFARMMVRFDILDRIIENYRPKGDSQQ